MPNSEARIGALSSNFERNVLLLDVREARQLARAAAMRQAGATVQCVTTGDAARAVWKPGSHQLVIIELDGAGADARQFYDYARALSPGQAFAFYIDEPPYLSPTPQGGGGVGTTARRAAQPKSRATSLGQATNRIAFMHASARRAESHAQAASRPSFSDAVKAAEAAAEKDAEKA
jgi:hypothetical protein